MKALLVIVYVLLGESVHTQAIEYDQMEVCKKAAASVPLKGYPESMWLRASAYCLPR